MFSCQRIFSKSCDHDLTQRLARNVMLFSLQRFSTAGMTIEELKEEAAKLTLDDGDWECLESGGYNRR